MPVACIVALYEACRRVSDGMLMKGKVRDLVSLQKSASAQAASAGDRRGMGLVEVRVDVHHHDYKISTSIEHLQLADEIGKRASADLRYTLSIASTPYANRMFRADDLMTGRPRLFNSCLLQRIIHALLHPAGSLPIPTSVHHSTPHNSRPSFRIAAAIRVTRVRV